jgi:hypothetical protein
MSEITVTNDAEAIEVLQEVLAYLRKRQLQESGNPLLDFAISRLFQGINLSVDPISWHIKTGAGPSAESFVVHYPLQHCLRGWSVVIPGKISGRMNCFGYDYREIQNSGG